MECAGATVTDPIPPLPGSVAGVLKDAMQGANAEVSAEAGPIAVLLSQLVVSLTPNGPDLPSPSV